MRNSIYRITLDMHDVASQVQITAKQHDTARKLHITLSENGSPYTIEEGCRAVLTINRSGSTVIIDDCEIKLNGSVIMYDFNSQTTEVLGINECEVKLYDPDGDIITSPRFTLLVDENVYNDGEDHGIDHRNVLNRDKEDQHPIKAITGLEKELDSKANAEKIYAEIALDRSRIDNIAALGQNSVIEVQKKYNTTGATTPLTFTLGNDGKCVVIIYYYKSAPNTETYSSSVLVNSQSIFTKTLDGAAGTYLEEVEFDGHSGDIVTITRDNVNVSINSVLYLTKNTTDNELADIRLGADGTIYPCAGDAVRGQVSALKDDVDTQVGALKSDLSNKFDKEDAYTYGTNIYDRDTVVDGYLNANGNITGTTNPSYFTSDFINLKYRKSSHLLSAIPTINSSGRIVIVNRSCRYAYFFDADKKVIPNTRLENVSSFDIPTSAVYMRLCYAISYKESDIVVWYGTDYNSISEYIPYKRTYWGDSFDKVYENTSNISALMSRTSIKIQEIVKPIFTNGNGLRIKFLGDSITMGAQGTGVNYKDTTQDNIWGNYYENVSGHCWVNNIRDYLYEKFGCVCKNYGVTGATSAAVLMNIDNIVSNDDDIVVVCIGINDRSSANSSKQLLHDRVSAIYDAIVAKGKPCILMSEIPVSIANETTTESGKVKNFHCEDIDIIYQSIAYEKNVEYISLYKLFDEYTQDRGITIESLLAPDGLHPVDDGYDVISYLVLNAMGIPTKRVGATW